MILEGVGFFSLKSNFGHILEAFSVKSVPFLKKLDL